MILFIDAQVLQTADASRGMGFYLHSILEQVGAMPEVSKAARIVFILNSSIENHHSVSKLLEDTVQASECIALPMHVRRSNEETYSRYSKKNRLILDAALSRYEVSIQNEGSVYFMPAQFANDIFPVFPSSTAIRKTLLFHDLIPYLYSQVYFPSYALASCIDYCERFEGLFGADTIVTNSQTTADDLMVYFGISEKRLYPILGSGASRAGFKPVKPKALKERPFVLMPSGDDIRKNNFRGVEAFTTAVKEAGVVADLVVTSRFSEGTQRRLQEINPGVIFVGNVSDAEYRWLVQNALFVYFPTEYEGLGMPVIEAVQEGVRVACSRISVFEEISTKAFRFFDPLSVTSMARVLAKCLNDASGSWRVSKAEYEDINKRFNWQVTAELFLEAILETSRLKAQQPKKRIAVFAPAVDSYSAIGKYVLETHAELSRLYDLTYFFEKGHTDFTPTRLNILKHAARSYGSEKFTDSTDFDEVFYHIGNSEFHVDTIFSALSRPGILILHDCHLVGIFDYMENRGLISSERRQVERLFDAQYADGHSSHIVSLVRRSKAVICHSRYAYEAVSKISKATKGADAHIVSHPIGTPRNQTYASDGDIIVSFAGIISPDKGTSLISEVAALPGVRVRVFGFGVLGDLTGTDRGSVTVLRDLSDLEFQNNMKATDILVNYRLNYHGETSRTASEGMRFGVNVIVKNVGWFSELPDDAVVKVAATSDISRAIMNLVDDTSQRATLHDSAINYARMKLTFDSYAQSVEKVRGSLGE